MLLHGYVLLRYGFFWKTNAIYKVMSQLYLRMVSEYDQELPQSQTADNPMAPRGRAAQPSRDTKKTN